MRAVQEFRDFVETHKRTLALSLAALLVFLVILLVINLENRPPRDEQPLFGLFASLPVDTSRFLMPSEPELLPELLEVRPGDYGQHAALHWQPFDQEARELIEKEAIATIDALLEHVP